MENLKTEGYVFMATSLDGFVAREDRSLDWLMKYEDTGDTSYQEFIKDKDVLIMGKGSFKTIMSFDSWPYNIPVIVMSKTLNNNDIPSELKDKVSLTTLSPIDVMKSCFKQGYKKAYVDGGLIVQSFLNNGLINEITLTQIPILIGSGKRLFGPLTKDIDLILKSTRSYGKGFVQTTYTVEK